MDKKQYGAIARMLGMKLADVTAIPAASTLGGMVKALLEKEGIADQFVDPKDGKVSAALAVAAFQAAFEKNSKLTVSEWVQSRRPTESTLDDLDIEIVAPPANTKPAGPSQEAIAAAEEEYKAAVSMLEFAKKTGKEAAIKVATEAVAEATAKRESLTGKPAAKTEGEREAFPEFTSGSLPVDEGRSGVVIIGQSAGDALASLKWEPDRNNEAVVAPRAGTGKGFLFIRVSGSRGPGIARHLTGRVVRFTHQPPDREGSAGKVTISRPDGIPPTARVLEVKDKWFVVGEEQSTNSGELGGGNNGAKESSGELGGAQAPHR